MHDWAILKGRIDQPLWLVNHQNVLLVSGVETWSKWGLLGGKCVGWVVLGSIHRWGFLGFWRSRVKQLGLVDWRRMEKGVGLEVVTSDLTKDGGKVSGAFGCGGTRF